MQVSAHGNDLRTRLDERGDAAGSGARALWWAVSVGTAVVLSALSVLRYQVEHLNADGLEQSVASIQHVTLFFWGQDRFASVVSWVASPVADPLANLVVCTFIDALAVHGLLLLLAWLGYGAVRGQRSARGTALLFATSAIALHVAVGPTALHQLCIESQPFALSWVAALGAFELWRRDRWWTRTVAVGAVAIAVGLSQLALLAAAAAALVDAGRSLPRDRVSGVLRRWAPFAVVWLIGLVVWGWLGARYGGVELPEVGHGSYVSFSPFRAVSGAGTAAQNLVGAFRPVPTAVLAVLAIAGVLAASRHPARQRLIVSAGLALLFAVGYWVLLSGNGWVAGNLYLVRYFFPVLLLVVLALGVGLALGIEEAAGALPIVSRVPALAAAVVAFSVAAVVVVGTGGPLQSPAQAGVLRHTETTADYVHEHEIRFVAGSFWVALPVVHQVLDGGRDAAYSVSSKSSGDRPAYLAALGEAASRGPVEAVCVGDAVDTCISYLEHWTGPGWLDGGADCPAPTVDPNLGPSPATCRLLRYDGVRG